MFPDYPFSSRYLQTPNGRLHYIDEGDGPAVVLLHGNPTWSYYYRHVIHRLSPRFRVIAPDHMGCGLSDKPADYDYCLENHIRNVLYLVEKLSLSRFSMVVHDWGGAIGMGYAVRHSEKIEKLVILNTAAFRSSLIPFRIRVCRWPVIGALIVRGCNGFAWPATFMAVSTPLSRDVAAAYLAPYDSWRNRIGVHRFVRDIPLTERHRSYRTLLQIEKQLPIFARNKTPMSIIWGGKDFCFNDHFFNQWRNRFPEAQTHYFSSAGHYVLEDAHGVAEPLIETFLEQ